MISGQIDRLRAAAQTYRRLGNHSAESMLLDAADTIWKLRDDLQRANAENAKLRELVRDLWEACPVDGYYCIYHCEHYDKESESHCKLEDRMRELGVEVNDGTE